MVGCNPQNLCSACAWEKKAESEARLREKAEQERRTKIKMQADEKEALEKTRLRSSILLTLDELRALTPYEFEGEIANMFRRAGFDVEQTPATNDFGRDAVMWKKGKKFLLECKRYDASGLSSRPDLQKFHSAMTTDNAQKGYFVTTGGFTTAAIEFSKTAEIVAIDQHQLLKFMHISKPHASADDSYQSICRECGDVVHHHLRAPETVRCRYGHSVSPTLTLDSILDISKDTTPACKKCGAKMRLINGKNGKFWGCSRYPRCSSSQGAKHRPRLRRS